MKLLRASKGSDPLVFSISSDMVTFMIYKRFFKECELGCHKDDPCASTKKNQRPHTPNLHLLVFFLVVNFNLMESLKCSPSFNFLVYVECICKNILPYKNVI